MRFSKSIAAGAVVVLLVLGLVVTWLGRPLAAPDAAAAVLRHVLGEIKDTTKIAGCIGLAGPQGETDFPPRMIDDLVVAYPGLHPVSECEDNGNRARRHGQLLLCRVDGGAAESSGTVRVTFLVVRGPTDTEERSFEVSRSLLGRMIVKDLGVGRAS